MREVPEAFREADHLTRTLEAAIAERDRLAQAHQTALDADKETAVALAATEQDRIGAKKTLGRANDALGKQAKHWLMVWLRRN